MEGKLIVMITVKESIDNIAKGEELWISLGNFLDEFYYHNKETRQQMIAEEPTDLKNVKKEYKAMFAATVHKLANDYKLSIPSWVWKKKYYMSEQPYFDGNVKGDLRLLFMYKSPSEFKHRNLFVDENVLKRV